MSGSGWAVIYMIVILKIPIIAALWLIWWAVQEPSPEEAGDGYGGGGGSHHPRLQPPRGPRRGPHAVPPPGSPSRVRVARARELARR